MSLYQKRPTYCYSIKTGELHKFESIYSACIALRGEYKNSWCNTIVGSIESPNNRKYSAIGHIWFDWKEDVDIVKPKEIYCALNYRYQVMNHKGDIKWENLEKAHRLSRCAVIAYNTQGEEIFYESVSAAAEDFGTPISNISRVLTNQSKGNSNHHLGKKKLTAAGWMWKYAD